MRVRCGKAVVVAAYRDAEIVEGAEAVEWLERLYDSNAADILTPDPTFCLPLDESDSTLVSPRRETSMSEEARGCEAARLRNT